MHCIHTGLAERKFVCSRVQKGLGHILLLDDGTVGLPELRLYRSLIKYEQPDGQK